VQYLLDTNVITALRRPYLNPAPAVWAASLPLTDLYTAAPVIAEIGLGVTAKERADPTQGAILRHWFESDVLNAFANRILAFDARAACTLARYRVPDQAPYNDALIAAIAEVNGMAIATRNIKHFEPLGIMVTNPWDNPTQ
jgi:predicted nucleic acid-binding protein